MKTVLKQRFFNRPVLAVAEELLGKFLVRKNGSREIAYMITEVEAYDGEQDKACHASRGMTLRTAVMYDEAGYWYVYLCYGVHEMLNIVTGPKEYPAAVLIRGVEGINGPGRVTKMLGIDRTFNAMGVCKESGLWIEDRGVVVKRKDIKRATRVGVAYAGHWAEKPWRFILLSSFLTSFSSSHSSASSNGGHS
jgi:DNA-3-methyladenine glycosylase